MMQNIFVPDPIEVWLPAAVVADDGSDVTVTLSDSFGCQSEGSANSRKFARSVVLDFPLQASMAEHGYENMCEMDNLNEASILENLRRRFLAQTPYTYCNGICFAVNPQQPLNIYNAETRSQYMGQPANQLPAHVYATSTRACHNLFTVGTNQSIVVSGESGAGKTETVKVMLHHIAEIAESPENCSARNPSLFHKVLTATPLLESFGNAKTVRNDNSSRVGKFLQLDFDAAGRMLCSRCQTFLLEKSRVTKHSANERNFHVFYELLEGPEKWKNQLELEGKTAAHFRYTQLDQDPHQSGDPHPQLDRQHQQHQHYPDSDSERHLATITACGDVLHMTQEALLQLYSILAGVLYLGQVSFPLQPSEVESDILPEELLTCAKLLRVEGMALAQALMCGVVDVQGTRIHKHLSPEQAAVARDALAKEVYARLFQWLVDAVNHSTLQQTAQGGAQQRQDADPSSPPIVLPCPNDVPDHNILPGTVSSGHISLLDIFGFECFDHNVFEQLCINYANEKLQRKFAADVIQSVQAEYATEGIAYDPTPFRDNSAVLQLIEGRAGIFDLLNEECVLPGGNESAFLSKLRSIKQPGAKDAAILTVELSSRATQFIVRHYAGAVTYDVDGFLCKNQDTVLLLASELLAVSGNTLLAQLFRPDSSGTSSTTPPHPGVGAAQRSKQASTIASKFRAQLRDLMRSIQATEVQYVRCIKPNTTHSSTVFDKRLVVAQLRSGGLVEAVKVSRSAFPHKMTHESFLRRYQCLYKQRTRYPGGGIGTVLVQVFGDPAPQVPYQVGTSKVYFAEGALRVLDLRLHRHLSAQATSIQRRARGFLCKVRFQRVVRALRVLQRAARVCQARTLLCYLRSSRSCLLQHCFVRWVFAGRAVLKAAVRLQALFRGRRASLHYRSMHTSVARIERAHLHHKQPKPAGTTTCSAHTQTAPPPPSASLATAGTQTEREYPRTAHRKFPSASPTSTSAASARTGLPNNSTVTFTPAFLHAAAEFRRIAQELMTAFSFAAPSTDADRDSLACSAVLISVPAYWAVEDLWQGQLSQATRAQVVDAGLQMLSLLVLLFLNSPAKHQDVGKVTALVVVCIATIVV